MKHPTDKEYKGILVVGKTYTHTDGSIAEVKGIAKNLKGMWCAELFYKYPKFKKYQQFIVPCYDFEQAIREKEWR